MGGILYFFFAGWAVGSLGILVILALCHGRDRVDRANGLWALRIPVTWSRRFKHWVFTFVAAAWLGAGMFGGGSGGSRTVVAAVLVAAISGALVAIVLKPDRSRWPRTAAGVSGLVIAITAQLLSLPLVVVFHRVLGRARGTYWPGAMTPIAEGWRHGLDLMFLVGWILLPMGLLAGVLIESQLRAYQHPPISGSIDPAV